jgi:hypothetical protein
MRNVWSSSSFTAREFIYLNKQGIPYGNTQRQTSANLKTSNMTYQLLKLKRVAFIFLVVLAILALNL